MTRFRLSYLAEADLAHILATSEERWGAEGKRRYALLAAAMRKAATEPEAPTTQDQFGLSPGIRSLHLRHARGDNPWVEIRRLAHVLYYRMVEPDMIDIVVYCTNAWSQVGTFKNNRNDDWASRTREPTSTASPERAAQTPVLPLGPLNTSTELRGQCPATKPAAPPRRSRRRRIRPHCAERGGVPMLGRLSGRVRLRQ